MKQDKYMGMDVHQATTVVCVLDEKGKRVLETIVATEAPAMIRLMESLSGPVHVTFEETTQAAWLYEVVRRYVAEVVVCDPRRNRLLQEGSKGDKPDAWRLAELLRVGMLKPVYHGHEATRTLKELVRAYESLSSDSVRVMQRIKAVYRGRGIRTPGTQVYQPKHRDEWLESLDSDGLRQRTKWLYEELDHLMPLRKEAKQVMLAEGRKHQAVKLLCTIPQMGPIRSAQLVAIVDTPFRFRTKRQLWSYSSLAVVTHASAEYEMRDGRVVRRKKPVSTRGLNRNGNRRLKELFVSAATGGTQNEPYRTYLAHLADKGMRPEMARLTLARKIAAIALIVWKKGEAFDAAKLSLTT